MLLYTGGGDLLIFPVIGASPGMGLTGFRHEPYIVGAAQRLVGSNIRFGFQPELQSATGPGPGTSFPHEPYGFGFPQKRTGSQVTFGWLPKSGVPMAGTGFLRQFYWNDTLTVGGFPNRMLRFGPKSHGTSGVAPRVDTHDLPPDPWLEDFLYPEDYLDEVKEAARKARKAQDHNRKARKLAQQELRQALENAVYGVPEASRDEFIETVAPEAVVRPGYEIDWGPTIGNLTGLQALLRRLENDFLLDARRREEDDIEVLLLLLN